MPLILRVFCPCLHTGWTISVDSLLILSTYHTALQLIPFRFFFILIFFVIYNIYLSYHCPHSALSSLPPANATDQHAAPTIHAPTTLYTLMG